MYLFLSVLMFFIIMSLLVAYLVAIPIVHEMYKKAGRPVRFAESDLSECKKAIANRSRGLLNHDHKTALQVMRGSVLGFSIAYSVVVATLVTWLLTVSDIFIWLMAIVFICWLLYRFFANVSSLRFINQILEQLDD